MSQEQERIQAETRAREEQAAGEKREMEKRKSPVFVAPTF
jgi:hypothetical protein